MNDTWQQSASAHSVAEGSGIVQAHASRVARSPYPSPAALLCPEGCTSLPLWLRHALLRREVRRLISLELGGCSSGPIYREIDARIMGFYSCCFEVAEKPWENLPERIRHIEDSLEEFRLEPSECLEARTVNLDAAPVGSGCDGYSTAVFEEATAILRPAYERGDLVTLACHGSLSTGDYTQFSDIDLIAVVRDKCLLDQGSFRTLSDDLARINAFIKSADPLAHHMVTVMAESDLGCYEESVLPISEWERAALLLGRPVLRFHLLPCRDESMRQLEHHASRLARVPESPWACRLLLSRLFLLPAIYQQAVHGVYVGKKSALMNADQCLPPFIQAALNAGTDMRNEWVRHSPPSSLPDPLRKALPSVRAYLIKHVQTYWSMVLNAHLAQRGSQRGSRQGF